MASPVPRPLGIRLLELGALLAFAAYATCFLFRITLGMDGLLDGCVLFFGICIGYLTADLISGIAHWLGDRFGDESTPLVGPTFIAPFREHHDDPLAMVRHGFVELAGNTAVLACPILIVSYHLVDLQSPSLPKILCTGALISALIGVVATNVIHRWAHMHEPPRLPALLQKTGLILTHERHARHHSGNHDRAYCITFGWLNNGLDALQIWSRAERLFGRKSST